MYAERFGWTPSEVDDLPARVEVWLGPMIAALDEARREQAKRE